MDSNPLTKKFFLWPYPTADLQQAIDELTPILQKSALSLYLDAPYHLADFIALTARNWNISPWWILISMQREQGALSAENPLNLAALEALEGYVGSDAGRVKRPGYYGIFEQIERLCDQSAWILGVEDSCKWPVYYRDSKNPWLRFALQANVHLLDVPAETYSTSDAGITLQLRYTPHKKVLITNREIADDYVPAKYII